MYTVQVAQIDSKNIHLAGIILAQDFCERKNPIWTKTVRDFQIQWDFFFRSLGQTEWDFFFFFFVKARFCIRIVCISIIIAYFVMYSKSG